MAALCNHQWTAHLQKISSVYTVRAFAEGPAVEIKILSNLNQKILLNTVRKQDPIIRLTYPKLTVQKILPLDQYRALHVWTDLAGKAARLFMLVGSLGQGEPNLLYRRGLN